MAIPSHKLLDTLIDKFDLKNDAQLARQLEILPPQLSKMRHGKNTVGPSVILRIHEHFGLPVKEIRELIG